MFLNDLEGNPQKVLEAPAGVLSGARMLEAVAAGDTHVVAAPRACMREFY